MPTQVLVNSWAQVDAAVSNVANAGLTGSGGNGTFSGQLTVNGAVINVGSAGNSYLQESGGDFYLGSGGSATLRLTAASGGIFSGDLSVAGDTDVIGYNLTVGSNGVSNSSLVMGGTGGNFAQRIDMLGGANFNWRISSSWFSSNDLQFTPSTSAGGATFTTPAVSMEGDSGAVIFTYNVGVGASRSSATGFTRTLNIEGTDASLQIYNTTTGKSWELGNDNTGALRVLNGGTNALTFNPSSSNAAFAADVTMSDGTLSTTQTAANEAVVKSDATSASFINAIHRLNAVRAASASYIFFQAYAGDSTDLKFQMLGDGNATCDGSWTGGGADLSEAMEWSDGNPDNEDRRGWTVVKDAEAIAAANKSGNFGKKYIRQCKEGEKPIGIVSVNAGVRMGHDLMYSGKYLRDEFDEHLTEAYTVTEWIELVPAVTEQRAVTWQKPVMEEWDEPVAAETKMKVIEGEIAEVVVKEATTKKAMRQVYKEEDVAVEAGVNSEGVWHEAGTKKKMIPQFTTENAVGVNGNQAFEMVELKPAEEIKHSYESDKIPEGVIVPSDAEIITHDEEGNLLERRVLNPDYDESREHENRDSRKEWADINVRGFSPVLNGQIVGDDWEDFGEKGPNTRLYLR